jgi:hypothetical protein
MHTGKFLMGSKTYLAVAAVIATTLLVSCGLCGDTELEAVASPAGTFTAVAYTRDCGATTQFVTRVDMRTHGYKVSRSHTVLIVEGQPRLTLNWISDSSVRISCRDCLSAIEYEFR